MKIFYSLRGLNIRKWVLKWVKDSCRLYGFIHFVPCNDFACYWHYRI